VAQEQVVIQGALDAARRGKATEGIAALRRLIQKQPGNLAAIQALGQLLIQTGQHAQAVYEFEKCVKAAPTVPAHHNNLGMALWHAKKYPEAVAPFREAVRLDPNYAIGHLGLAMALVNVMDVEGAAAAARRAAELKPDLGEAYYNLGLALMLSGQLEEGADTMRRCIDVAPQNVQQHSTYLLMLNYRARPPEELLREHREFGRRHPPIPGLPAAATDPDPDRRIRIGYLSTDLRTHSVGYFARAFFSHRDRQRTEVLGYYASPVSDDMTAFFRKSADRWVEVASMSDQAVDRRIRDDRIDVLVELGGHSPGHRLTALVSKPAPIVVSALGYPNTTGMAAIDYRLVDSLSDPPGSEQWNVERLFRVDPCFLCYHPPPTAPEQIQAHPGADGVGPITFGSFNAFPKVSPEVIRAWAEILRRVEGSRLVIKNTVFGSDVTRRRVSDRFAEAGADPARISLLPPNESQADHLRAYGAIDIALDTFPYNGTTTTCEALWMGVPVVSLAGSLHAGRVGLSLLSAADLPDLVASDANGYVQTAASLAADRARLRELRQSLRARVAASPLCDAAAYGRRIDAAYRQMWQTWCANRAKA
jgi:predicted O-linked N-acetylglucosamine transferase (SPINDLY family)